MDKVPIIGVTRCSRLDDYVASIEQSGARPRVLEISESPRALMDTLDGVLLTGGGDVDPVLYGEERHSTVEDAEPGRDEFEIDLARRARAADMPLLAICRGAQVLNVASGGTLVQDIPSAVTTDLSHSLTIPRDCLAHAVQITRGSRLHNALGASVDAACTCRVNSRHHQSVCTIGKVGVQWHPENFWRTGEFRPLFDAFVEAARLWRA
jgi:putative glutamine amidotransferase